MVTATVRPVRSSGVPSGLKIRSRSVRVTPVSRHTVGVFSQMQVSFIFFFLLE
jgi:hypothetical protein